MPEIEEMLTIEPPLGLLHHGNDRAHAEEHALGVDAHLPVPGRDAEAVRIAAADAGVVDEDVDLAVGRERRGDGGVPVRLARHVEPLEARLAAGRGDRSGDRLALGLQDVAQDHLGAFARKQARGGRAHARGRARDDGDLVCKTHGGFSLPVRPLSGPKP